VFRLHGALLGAEHGPWTFGPHTSQIYDAFSHLHLSARPLIMALWKEADETGIPPTRPLYVEYPNDPTAATQDQEWLLGPNLLVAPIVQEGASSRSVYFPAGCWRDPATGQEVTGPSSATVAAEVAQLPFFFRCGTTPFKPPQSFASHLRQR
jgi:sulfoquinovosidase